MRGERKRVKAHGGDSVERMGQKHNKDTFYCQSAFFYYLEGKSSYILKRGKGS